MIVKICGITNREDAMAAVDAGAAAIGFNFYRDSPRYISPTGAAMLAEKIPSNVWKVGVFVNEEAESVARIALQAGLDVAQLHGTSEARGLRVWQACTIGDWELIAASSRRSQKDHHRRRLGRRQRPTSDRRSPPLGRRCLLAH
jgi:phosphoribosylanthranilate isomerase